MNKIPITVGVIGHVDAIITDEHKNKIKSIFNDIAGRYPTSPVVLFSQLALGADTAVAKCFLELKEEYQRDYRLVVPIPYNIETYKKTQFETSEQIANFNNLLAKAERVFELTDDIAEKNDYYRQSGEFVADSSMILIALWDKIENGKTGGSAEIVRYKIDGSYNDKIAKHIFDAKGALISLPCNRKKTINPRDIILEDDFLQKLLDKSSSVKKALEKVEFLNIQAAKTNELELKKSESLLYSNTEMLNQNAALLRDYFVIANTQAIRSYKRYGFRLLSLFIMGFVFFGFFEAYKALGLSPWNFYATALALSLSVIFLYISKEQKYHESYIDNRILAETLRVQFFWNLRKIPLAVADLALHIHTVEYDWARHIIEALHGYTFPDIKQNKQDIFTVKKEWIDDQKKFFHERINMFERIKKYFEAGFHVFLSSSVLLLIGIFFMKQFDVLEHSLEFLVFIDTLLLALAVFIKAYHEKKGYEEIISEYMMMFFIYNVCSEKIDTINNSDLSQGEKERELDELLILTGKEAIAENGNWYMVYKEKSLELKGVG